MFLVVLLEVYMSKNKDNRILDKRRILLICNYTNSSVKKSQRKIAHLTETSQPTVFKIQRVYKNLTSEQRNALSLMGETEIQQLFYPEVFTTIKVQPNTINLQNKFQPDFADLASKMIETKMDKRQVWLNYCKFAEEQGADVFSLAYFYRRLEEELEKIKTVDDYYMIQDFAYGEQMQADFTGDRYTLKTYNGNVECWILVITLPASYYCYAEFVMAQSTEESCRVIGNAIRYFGNRTPPVLVSDNAKCFVNSHTGSQYCLNRSFENYIAELGICFMPTPVRHPQAKSAVEYSVRLVQNCIKNNGICFSDKTNTVSGHSQILQDKVNLYINKVPFRKSVTETREFLFRTYEQDKLRPVYRIPEFQKEFKTLVVSRSYHVQVMEHQYSVPYQYIRKAVQIYLLNDFVVIKHEQREIARHTRTDGPGITTLHDHMPMDHQQIKENSEILRSEDEILAHCAALNEDLYTFCLAKITLAKKNAQTYLSNAKTCCRAVIKFYEKEQYKKLAGQACREILNLPSDSWVLKDIRKLYMEKVKILRCEDNKNVEVLSKITRNTTFLKHNETPEIADIEYVKHY